MSGDGRRNLVSVPILACGTCGLALLAGAAALTLWKSPAHEHPPPPVAEATAQRPIPSLHCLFSDFTHASVVVGFDFAVDRSKGTPRFAERAEAVRNDPAVNFDVESRPTWSYARDEDGNQSITSPDGATRIMLYGLKLGTGDAWVEAGIRSNTFRNLDGKCLQLHLDDIDHLGSVESAHP